MQSHPQKMDRYAQQPVYPAQQQPMYAAQPQYAAPQQVHVIQNRKSNVSSNENLCLYALAL